MNLSKEAKEGLDWAVFEVRRRLTAGQTPELALKEAGIKGIADTYFFMEYLRETKEKYLLKTLTK